MLRLRESGIDQAQGSPAGVIARLGERENHAPMVARYRGLRDGRGHGSVKALKVES